MRPPPRPPWNGFSGCESELAAGCAAVSVVLAVAAPIGGHGHPICWYWRSDADGVAAWGPTSRPVPQWTRPGATAVQTLGRQGDHH